MSVATCVIVNPAAGRGQARRCLEAVRRRFGPGVEYRTTDGPWHAAELARKAAAEGFARVVAAGGDGTVHEVANGLLAAGRDDVTLSVCPVGSMNDYAYTLGLMRLWKGDGGHALDTVLADVGAARTAGKERFFVNGCGVGFNGMVAAEVRRLRPLCGRLLYAAAFLSSTVRHVATPNLALKLDGTDHNGPTLSLSLNLGQREGGFRVTPDARLDDGAFEVFHVGPVCRWELIRYLPTLMASRLPTDHPHLRRGRCGRASIRATTPLGVHTDGELFALPADGVRELDVELLPRRLRVEVCRPFLYVR